MVVGGSLGGLFAANLLLRDGWDVQVYEQSAVPLAGRGAGIITHPDLFAALRLIGIPASTSIGVDIEGRIAFARDGHTIGTLPVRQCLTTWGQLHTLLLSVFPAERYHLGHPCRQVETDGRVAIAHFANGASAESELLVAADGIRSTIRQQLAPDTQPAYAGYIAWRGLVEEKQLSPDTHRDLFPRFAFSLAEREHMLGYPVAGFDNSTVPGERCFNFVWYRPAAAGAALNDLCTDSRGHQHDMSIPPPLIRPSVIADMQRAAADHLSPQFNEVVAKTRQPFFQAIFDLESPQMHHGCIALLGDAAFVARPHCGMGVSKAAGDAIALIEALRDTGSLAEALTRYTTMRVRFGHAVVAHARELGSYLQATTEEERHRHRHHHSPEAVMREIAVSRVF